MSRPASNLKPVSRVESVPRSNASASSGSELSIGTRIEHERFGIGMVTKLEGTGDNLKATVEFSHVGTKQLLLKFAKYKVLK